MGMKSGMVSPRIRVSHAVSSEVAMVVTLENTDAASQAVIGAVRTVSFTCITHIPALFDMIILFKKRKLDHDTLKKERA
jgi:hypothetical protein